jgi:hypothetical protein
MTIFGLKVMVKSGPLPFRFAAAQCRKICPEVLNWPGWLAGISDGRVEFQNNFF